MIDARCRGRAPGLGTGDTRRVRYEVLLGETSPAPVVAPLIPVGSRCPGRHLACGGRGRLELLGLLWHRITLGSGTHHTRQDAILGRSVPVSVGRPIARPG